MSSDETTKVEEVPVASALATLTDSQRVFKAIVHRPVGVPRSILTMGDDELARLSRLAEMLESSSLAFKKDGTRQLSKGDLFLVFAKGIEVGFEPMAALDSINIIAGKPTIDPAGMLALINGNGLLEDMQIIEKSAERSVIMMKRTGRSPLTHKFTMADAALIKAKENQREISLAEKTNYKQQPAVMLQWRNVAAMCRLLFPDALKGLKYTPEELGADVEVDEGGNMVIIDAPVTRNPQPKTETPAPQPVPPQPAQQQSPQQSAPAGQPKTAGETWLKNEKAQTALKTLLTELGYKEVDKEKWLSQVHSGQTLTRFGESTFNQKELFARLKEIAATINPAQPKGQHQQVPQPTQQPAARKPGDGLANPVIVDFVRYVDAGKQKHLQFETESGDYIRAYGRSTTFKKMVGEEYYAANSFEDMEPNTDEAYEIDSLQITWELKTPDGGNPYLIAKVCKPLVPDEPDESEDSDGTELEDFLNDEDFTANQAELEGAIS